MGVRPEFQVVFDLVLMAIFFGYAYRTYREIDERWGDKKFHEWDHVEKGRLERRAGWLMILGALTTVSLLSLLAVMLGWMR